jgi:hypothetical protein
LDWENSFIVVFAIPMLRVISLPMIIYGYWEYYKKFPIFVAYIEHLCDTKIFDEDTYKAFKIPPMANILFRKPRHKLTQAERRERDINSLL